jgi:hypothetical protein
MTPILELPDIWRITFIGWKSQFFQTRYIQSEIKDIIADNTAYVLRAEDALTTPMFFKNTIASVACPLEQPNMASMQVAGLGLLK